MRARKNRLALSLAAFGVLAAAASPAGAVVVERIVAVIGDRPVLQSELEARARPFYVQVLARTQPGPQQEVAKAQVKKELLNKIIDDELEAQAADKAKVSVSLDEVDNALKTIAAQQNMSTESLIAGARKSGLTEQDYREEIRRQILEGKMLQLRVKGRIRITEEDVKGMYERTLKTERKTRLEYRVSWIVIRIPAGSSPDAVAERTALAESVAGKARRGADFGALAARYSDDTATRDKGGDLGIRAPSASPMAASKQKPVLAPELEGPVMALETGEVTQPLKAADALVIIRLNERQASQFKGYEESKNEMLQRLQSEILDKAKRKWLDELKGRTHIDVRL